MKIKTITCHNVFNYGASLQSHALMSYLKEQGHDVEVIDYMPPYIRKNLGLFAIGPRYKKNIFISFAFYCYVVPIRILQRKARRKYSKFISNYMQLTHRYNNYEELKNNPPQADLYFCGSDQIWNTNIGNGLDPAFYIDFAPKDTVRASYAASFSIPEIPKQHIGFVKEMLSKMDFISVREKTGLKILNTLDVNHGVQVLDPVFLHEKEHWLDMIYKPLYNNYILVYDQENSMIIQHIASKISKITKKKIVALRNLYPQNYANYQEKYAGPIDFISLIANADFVITNSFHCCAFSIITERQFYVVPRTHQNVNSRMMDLLTNLHISERLINTEENIEQIPSICYEKVNPILKKMQAESKEYIQHILNSIENKHE